MKLAYVRREQDARLVKYLRDHGQAGQRALHEAAGYFYLNLSTKALKRLQAAGIITLLPGRGRWASYKYILTTKGWTYANVERALPVSAYK